ncbi:hypothetical protein GC167_02860 [bacterium]|nr:hypothetical protein [bacterium]
MKQFFALALVAGFATAQATVLTVSNNPDRPAQYTTVQAAVNAANPGDTLLIAGGINYQESVTIPKKVVLFGEGLNAVPTEGAVETFIFQILFQRLNSSVGSDGSRMYGIHSSFVNLKGSFTGQTGNQGSLDDIVIERCNISQYINFEFAPNGGYSNVTLRNCLIRSVYLSDPQITSTLFTNNVFHNSAIFDGSYDINGGVVVRNNVFINNIGSSFQGPQELIVENNIFYKNEFTGCTNCTFNNNISYICNNNTLPPAGAIGSGNLINQNPQFQIYPALGGVNMDWAHNFTPQPGSPALGTGTNATNIGLTGGNAPVANVPQWPKIPAVTQINIPVSSVPAGGTLQINIQAKTRN